MCSLQNPKPLVFLGVPSLVVPGVGSNIRGVPSRSKEDVLEKDHLLKRNHYKNFLSTQDEINAYRGTSTSICFLRYRNVLRLGDPMFTEM
jgi:hypothetical protein